MRLPKFLLRLVAAVLHHRQMNAHKHAARYQAKLLKRFVQRYQHTEMGRAFGLADIRSPLDFSTRVPTRTAADYTPWWNRVLTENPPGLVHPSRLVYMAKSSGTSGRSKYVPFSEEQMAVFKKFSNQGFFHVFRELNDYSLLDENILVNSGAAMETFPDVGITAALGSGLATLNATRFAQALIRPTAETMAIANWEEKIRRTIEETIHLDIRMATGVPIAFVSVLEHLLAYANAHGIPAKTAKDIWPNLKVYAYSGTSIEMFRQRITTLLGEGVEIFEIYSTTEAPIGFQYKFGKPGLLVDVTSTYFEFEPADPDAKQKLGRRLGLHEIEVGIPYDIVVTSPGGIFAYQLGDRVEFLSKNPYVLQFCGRNIEEINICTEHLRLPHAQSAIDASAAQHAVKVRHFLLCPQLAANPDEKASGYEWLIEFDLPPADTAAFTAALDQHLKEIHDMYRMYRSSEVMKPPMLNVIAPGTFDRYARENLAFGQGKLVNLQNDRLIADKIIALQTS